MKYVKTTLLSILVIGLTALVLVACGNSPKFVTSDGILDLKQNIEIFINRGDVTGVEINIRSTLEVDNKKIASFAMLDNRRGYCVLNKYGDKYKIISTNLSTEIVDVPVIETNKSKYIFAIGGEYNKDIHSLKIKLKDASYTFVITEPYFIQTQKLTDEADINSAASFTAYDNGNNDITKTTELVFP